MRRTRVAHRECGEMNAGIARHRAIKLAAKRGIRRLVENFDIAVTKHARHVAGPAQNHAAFARSTHLGIDLDRARRRGKASTYQRSTRGIGIGREMPDMIEKNLLARRKLAIDVIAVRAHGHSIHGDHRDDLSALTRCSASLCKAARSILLVEASGSLSRNQTKRGCW